MKKNYLVLIVFFLTILTGQAQNNPQLTVTLDDGMPYTPQNLNVGDVINYTNTVTNTGNVTVLNIIVTNNNATLSGTNFIGDLAPGQTASLYSTHVVTQADIDTGYVTNLAVGQGFFYEDNIVDVSDDIDPASPGGNDDPTITHISQNPQISVLKDDQLPYTPQNLSVGDVITYQISVSNTGNVTINLVNITDNNATVVSGNPITNSEPGTTHVVIAEHTVTQADIDAGQVSNQATGTFDFQGTTYTTLSDADATNTIPDEPTITLLQTNAVDDYWASKITVYPTVVMDDVYIVSDELKIEKIIFFNSIGQFQAEMPYHPSGIYQVSDFASGTYLLKIKTGKGMFVKKIIKH